MNKSMQKGFTLIELMVVIAVIGILAAIALVSLTGVQRTARDAQRKSDVASYDTALARIYADTQAYPASAVGGDFSAPAAAGIFTAAGALVAGTYLPGVLQDPSSTTTNCRSSTGAAQQCRYGYIANGGSYSVWAYCENTALTGFNNLFYKNGRGLSGGCGSGTAPTTDPPTT